MAHFLVCLHLIKHLSAGTCGQGDKEEFFMDFFVHNMLFHSDTVLSRRGMELSYSKWKLLFENII